MFLLMFLLKKERIGRFRSYTIQAEIMELKANPIGQQKDRLLNQKLKGKALLSILIEKGTLNVETLLL